MKVGDLVKRRQYGSGDIWRGGRDVFLVIKVNRQGVKESVRLWQVGTPYASEVDSNLINSNYFEVIG